MKVIKRNGSNENISFDKILLRLTKLSEMEPIINIDYSIIAQKVISQIYDGIHTKELDELAANICTSYSTKNPEYSKLASRIIISNNQKNTPNTYCINNIPEVN